MKNLVIACAVGFLVFASPGAFLSAQQGKSASAAFEKILEQYYVIQAALANDTTNGVEQASQEIVKQAAAAEKAGQKGPDFAAIKTSAAAMNGKNLKQARTQFFELSKPIIAELKRDPSWQNQGFTYTCSMAKKSWAQEEKDIRNPYYGKSMLKCGEPL
jgi:seryl-tRNA(Sec) selenium transferase